MAHSCTNLRGQSTSGGGAAHFLVLSGKIATRQGSSILISASAWLPALRGWAKVLKRDVIALWIAARDPRVPLAAKLVAGLVAAYALSPIDLIPDFIPIIGYLDDLLLVPLGMMLAVWLVPAALMAEFRAAAALRAGRPVSRWAAGAIISLWLASAGLAAWWIWRSWR